MVPGSTKDTNRLTVKAKGAIVLLAGACRTVLFTQHTMHRKLSAAWGRQKKTSV